MSLANFFNPLSIAVVGASRDPNKIGTIVVQNLIDGGYQGTIYPINPHADTILWLTTYPTLQACPVAPELVVISLPAQYVLDILKQIVEQKIKYVVVLTAGFKEIWEEGAKIEQEIQNIVREGDLTLLWPNCLWFASVTNHLNATFAELEMVPGSLKIISQSGAIASAFFDRSQAVHLWMDACVTVGNKAWITENDLLSYRNEYANRNDPIGLYLESIADGKRFLQITKELTKKNPVFLLKPGKSVSAQHAMQSHTWSIAWEDKVLSAVCEQAGIMRCETLEQFFDLSMYFSRQPAPKGKRVAIISNAGGPAVITTDLLDDAWLEVAQISDETKKKLTDFLPRAASVRDPIDLLGDAQADRYEQAIQTIIDDEAEVDALLIILTPQIMTQIEKTALIISDLSKKYAMPIVCAFIGNHHVIEGQKILHAHHIPCFAYPEKAVYVLAKAYQREEQRKALPSNISVITPLSQKISFAGRGLVDSQQTQRLLENCGLSTPRSQLISTLDEARKFVLAWNYPVVMKLVWEKLLHKIDVGGVITNIRNEEQLHQAFTTLQQTINVLAEKEIVASIQIQQQIQNWVELIVWYKKDPTFGELILLWPGGSLTNILPNHAMSVLPVSKWDILAMLQKSPLRKVMNGYRGHKSYAIEQLLTFLEGFVQLVQSIDRIDQAEINPIIVTTDGVYAVDPKIVLL